MASNISTATRTVQRKVYATMACDCTCKYDRPNRAASVAENKRIAARVTRRRLAAALRREEWPE